MANGVITVKDLRLNDIPFALRQALDCVEVDEETGEVFGMDGLNEVTEKAEYKIAGTALYIREREAYLDACRQALETNAQRIAQEEKRLEWLKDKMYDGMKALDVQQIESPSIVVKFKKNPVHVEVLDESLIPDKYWVQPEPKIPPPRIDKKMIKQDLDKGIEVNGAKLERTEVLVIK